MEQAIICVHAKFELAQKSVKEKQKGEISTEIVAVGIVRSITRNYLSASFVASSTNFCSSSNFACT